MQKHVKQLQDFHHVTKSYWRSDPTIAIPDDIKESRIRIMQEEMIEVIAAIYKNEPVENVGKELADLIYTAIGTAGAFGLGDKLEAIFDAVHASNMSKIGPGGEVLYNEHGKVIKPPTYKAPDIKKIIGEDK